MSRNNMLVLMLGAATIFVLTLNCYQEETRPGVILTVIENRVPVENENLPTSPDPGNFPKSMYLNINDQVKIIHDPVYEYSVDENQVPIRTSTPFRKVEIEIISGEYIGSTGFIPRNALSRIKSKPRDNWDQKNMIRNHISEIP